MFIGGKQQFYTKGQLLHSVVPDLSLKECKNIQEAKLYLLLLLRVNYIFVMFDHMYP